MEKLNEVVEVEIGGEPCVLIRIGEVCMSERPDGTVYMKDLRAFPVLLEGSLADAVIAMRKEAVAAGKLADGAKRVWWERPSGLGD